MDVLKKDNYKKDGKYHKKFIFNIFINFTLNNYLLKFYYILFFL